MSNFLQFFVLLPLFGFLISLLFSSKKEKHMSKFILVITALHLLGSIIFIISWLNLGALPLNLKEVTIYKSEHYHFFIDFYFEYIGAVYLFVGSLITLIITSYSRVYLHREDGYKRYFNTIMFFFTGYNVSILSGNFETLFLGWEILGLSSFLLITFYRDRYLPVSNGFKVYSYYRIGDIGLILAMWASHIIFHNNITFAAFDDENFVLHHLPTQSFIGAFIGLAILMSAASKSALLPFSSWIPRAMEGPTPSSAIFYGALSIHLGSFLLLRTFPLWEHQWVVRVIIFMIGLLTSIVTYLISNSQSSIKAQIAYASLSQIGINVMLVALGFEWLALYHFVGNAFFRTYQLLVSPSVVSYQIKHQMFNVKETSSVLSIHKTFQATVFMLSLKDFQLDDFLNRLFWKPLKKIGGFLNFLSYKTGYYYFLPLFLVHLVLVFYKSELPVYVLNYMPEYLAFIGMMAVFKAYAERKSPLLAWVLIVSSYYWICLATAFNELLSMNEIIYYLSGVTVFGIIGFIILNRLYHLHKRQFNLNQYFGYHQIHPKKALLFLLCTLGVIGFPISPTFIGIDLIFSHINKNQFFMAFFISIAFIISGIAAVRIYAKLFLGIYVKPTQSIPNLLS